MPEELIIAMATTVILATIKSPSKRERLRRAMAKIYKTIGNAYMNDQEFQKLIQP